MALGMGFEMALEMAPEMALDMALDMAREMEAEMATGTHNDITAQSHIYTSDHAQTRGPAQGNKRLRATGALGQYRHRPETTSGRTLTGFSATNTHTHTDTAQPEPMPAVSDKHEYKKRSEKHD